MRPALRPRQAEDHRLLIVSHDRPRVTSFSSLVDELNPGDLLVFNDAATFPAVLQTRTENAMEFEMRLLPKHPRETRWRAIALGAGSWKQKTEDRADPPIVRDGSRVLFTGALVGKICKQEGRLLELTFNLTEAKVWEEIYRIGRPIQYSYLERELELWDVQTLYASRPWASEMPSAGNPFTSTVLARLKARAISLATLTHATGISSSGDRQIDRLLPMPEFYEIPEVTVEAIRLAQKTGVRIIAVGTSVVRALESAAMKARPLTPGFADTSLIINADHVLRVVDGVISGIHDVTESHFRLLEAFSSKVVLQEAATLAEQELLLCHEFGDSCLVWR